MRLTERHEALAQSVELLLAATRENTAHINKTSENIDKLVQVTNPDADHIRAMVRIAEFHDRRIPDLENGE